MEVEILYYNVLLTINALTSNYKSIRSCTFCYFVYCQFSDCKPFGVVRSHFINCSTIEESSLPSWKRFFEFSSFNCEGKAYMSPFDFMQSLTSKASPEALQLTKETPSVTSSSCTFFRDANHQGLISYFDYLFLLSLLSEPESRFRIAFDLFDQNKDGKLEMDEFYSMVSGILPKKLRENHYEKNATKHELRSSKMVNPMKDEAEASTSHDASTSSSVVNNDSLEGRRCEQVKTLEKAKDVITTSNQVLSVVMLPSTAGDSGSDDTDPKYLPDDPKDEFYPAGDLEVEKELDVEEFEDINLSQKQRGALPQWKKAFTVSPQEIPQFIGLILLSGYNCQPEAKHYWSTQPDIGAQGAISCMSHNRFMKIKNLVKHGMFHEKLSVDESIVPYFGRHAAKMFLKGKPIRFGYTVWMLCGNDGYPYHMIIYQGKEIHASKVPLSTRVISNMVDIIQENSNTTRHTLYFDNFFNSYDLLVMLSELKMRAIGTIRPYRSNGVDAVMLPDKDLMKQNRTFIDPKRSISTTLATPDLDRLPTAYRPTIRRKKWYWPLFINAVNIATVAAWRIHCFVEERPHSHLELRRQAVLSLLQSERTATPRAASGFMSQLTDIRFDGISDYTKDGCSIFTTLSNHFFGSDHKSTLSYVDFHRFIRNFQIEVWEFQFMTFSTSKKDLTELEFAKMIYSYIYLPLHHQEQFFKRLEAKSHLNLLNRISFEEVCKFFTLLNNLNNFSYALHLCNLSNDLLTHAEFQRAVNASCGFKFQPNVVSSIFNVFTTDNNGKLSVNEFISMLQNCRQSFIFKEPAQSHTSLDNYMQCVRSKIMQSLSSFK
ncbi:Calcium uptake protein 3, mitochondrial [Trichinella sp. T9]|nr:Calcium uptake protein 3, mitochondrial [Trichinella sp. T9]